MTGLLQKLVFAGLGIVGGIGLALVSSIAAGMLIGIACQMLNPNDPSAGSAAEIVIFLIPLGSIFGAVAGTVIGWKYASRVQRKPAAGNSATIAKAAQS